jgi:SOS-response transcriptional repressor LexA
MTDPKTLARTNDPQTSKDAASNVKASQLEQAVLDFIESQGNYGATIAECVKHFNPESSSSITSRPSGLERKNLIFYRGDTRKGNSGRQQRIIRAIRYKGLNFDNLI